MGGIEKEAVSTLGSKQARESSRMKKSEETLIGRKTEGALGREVRGTQRSSTSSIRALDNLPRNDRRGLVPCSHTEQEFRLLNLGMKRKGVYRGLGNLGVIGATYKAVSKNGLSPR